MGSHSFLFAMRLANSRFINAYCTFNLNKSIFCIGEKKGEVKSKL